MVNVSPYVAGGTTDDPVKPMVPVRPKGSLPEGYVIPRMVPLPPPWPMFPPSATTVPTWQGQLFPPAQFSVISVLVTSNSELIRCAVTFAKYREYPSIVTVPLSVSGSASAGVGTQAKKPTIATKPANFFMGALRSGANAP